MHGSDALTHWLTDRRAQRRTMEGVEAFGHALAALPTVAALERELDSIEGDGADAILSAARRFLDRSDGISACVEAMVARAASDPFFRPPLRAASSDVHWGLVLLDRPLLSVLLAFTTPDALAAKRTSRIGPASISFGGQHSLFRFLRAGGATLAFWEAPEIEAGFTAETSGRCRCVERRRIEDGETIELNGRHQSFVIDHAVSTVVYLQALTTAGAAPLMVEYDSDSLGFAGASSADDVSSRVQMMLSLLRAMGRDDAAPLFREMLGSPHFYTRWQTMREFLALDAELAYPHLQAMVESDPHPEVRAAAAQTLAAFFAPDNPIGQEAFEPCHA